MRLIKIHGKVWELTCLQETYDTNRRNVPEETANKKVILNQDISDITRVLSGYKVRCSNARAIIEIDVNGFPQQHEYVIYLTSKGFCCNIKGKKTYLHELIS